MSVEPALLAAITDRPDDAVFEWEWKRGFVNEVACGPAALIGHGPDLLARRRCAAASTAGWGA